MRVSVQIDYDESEKPNQISVRNAFYAASDNFIFAYTLVEGKPCIIGVADVKSELVYAYGENAHKFKEIVGSLLPGCKIHAHKCTRHAAHELEHELYEMQGFYSSY